MPSWNHSLFCTLLVLPILILPLLMKPSTLRVSVNLKTLLYNVIKLLEVGNW